MQRSGHARHGIYLFGHLPPEGIYGSDRQERQGVAAERQDGKAVAAAGLGQQGDDGPSHVFRVFGSFKILRRGNCAMPAVFGDGIYENLPSVFGN